MNSRSSFIPISAILLALLALPTFAQPEVLEEPGHGLMVLSGGALTAENYYNVDGDLQRFDTLKTHYGRAAFAVTLRYGLIRDLQIDVDVPIAIHSLTSSALFPDRQIVAPDYYGLGATYELSDSVVFTGLSAMLRIPRAFHQGVYDDPKHPTFLSDGFLEFTTMLRFGFVRDAFWMRGAGGYTFRAEEPLDEIPFEVQFGLTRVEGTGVFVGVEGVVSMGDVTQPARPFYAGASGSPEERARTGGGRGVFRTIDRENYLSLNAGAYVHLFGQLLLIGRYDIRLFGYNALALRGASLGVGYRF